MSDSDSVDESKIPSREECENRCQKFAEITGTDSALAMFYLQDRDWELDVSIYPTFSKTKDLYIIQGTLEGFVYIQIL